MNRGFCSKVFCLATKTIWLASWMAMVAPAQIQRRKMTLRRRRRKTSGWTGRKRRLKRRRKAVGRTRPSTESHLIGERLKINDLRCFGPKMQNNLFLAKTKYHQKEQNYLWTRIFITQPKLWIDSVNKSKLAHFRIKMADFLFCPRGLIVVFTCEGKSLGNACGASSNISTPPTLTLPGTL